jgi:hypothetical protein
MMRSSDVVEIAGIVNLTAQVTWTSFPLLAALSQYDGEA